MAAGVVLAGSVLAALVSFAQAPSIWTEPTVAPPGGNTPTPLNVGPAPQTKDAGLWLNIGGAQVGLIVDQGNVGIGTRTPGSKFVVSGQGDFMNNRIKGVATPIDGLDAVNKDYIDALTGGGGEIVLFGIGTAGANEANMGSTPACPTGWAEVHKGYGPHWRAILIYGQSASGAADGGWYSGTNPPPKDPRNPPRLPDQPDGEEPRDPPPPPEQPGPVTPSGIRNELLPPLGAVPRAYAQGATEALIGAAIGSDSVCSAEQTTIVPAWYFSQSGTNPNGSALTANACEPANGTCNRCRVCISSSSRVGP